MLNLGRNEAMHKDRIEIDVVVIGAGSAGLVARRAAKNAGASVLLCDGGPLGTVCARVGCMPSKLLIAAANSARAIRRAPQFGIYNDPPNIDGRAVMDRVRAERDRFTGFVVRDIENLPANEFLAENVRFEEPGVLRSQSGRYIHYKAVVIATGSQPFIPDPFPALETTLYTSDTIFEIPSIPKRLAVIGAGVIGLELGQAFGALGSQVTVLARDAGLGVLKDPDVINSYQTSLSKEVRLLQNVTVTAAEESDGQATLSWTTASDENFNGSFDAVLVAAGRRSDLGSLGLDTLGISTSNPRDWKVQEGKLQIGKHPIFTAGDVNGIRPILHEAADEGRIAGENAARTALYGHADGRCFERRTPMSIAFTEPQTVTGGTAFSNLHAGAFEVGEATFSSQGRARIDALNEGIVHIYGAKGDGLLLGFEMSGPSAEHVAHLLSWAIQRKMTVLEALDMPFYHPVIEEGIRTALQRLAKKLDIRNASRVRANECAPME